MKLSWEALTLDLRTTFRIAHGTSDQRLNVLVHLDEGFGEAAAVPHYNETQIGIMEYLSGQVDCFSKVEEPSHLEDILSHLPPGSLAARTAIDIALHDLWGKRLGQPLYRLFGLNPELTPQTSYTIGMDTPEHMAESARKMNWPVYKIKLGSLDDEAIVKAIRQATDAHLRVDANGGWSREQAARLIPRLAQYNLEFVEQPLPAEDIDGLHWLSSLKLGVPIFADESAQNANEIACLAGVVDGVVVKIMKACGIRGALAAIHTARAVDMKIMISCMVESSVGVTAAAHLAPLCDYADLDGPLLIRNDRFEGVRYDQARLILPSRPGLGVIERQAS